MWLATFLAATLFSENGFAMEEYSLIFNAACSVKVKLLTMKIAWILLLSMAPGRFSAIRWIILPEITLMVVLKSCTVITI